MKQNIYRGECAYCGLQVFPMEGWIVRVGSRIMAAHKPCYQERFKAPPKEIKDR